MIMNDRISLLFVPVMLAYITARLFQNGHFANHRSTFTLAVLRYRSGVPGSKGQ